MASENIHPVLAQKIRESELAGGIQFGDLPAGSKVRVRTRSTNYIVERGTDRDYIKGHPEYCPERTPCRVQGSTFGGSVIKIGFIGIGMHMEVSLEGGRKLTTSTICDAALAGEQQS